MKNDEQGRRQDDRRDDLRDEQRADQDHRHPQAVLGQGVGRRDGKQQGDPDHEHAREAVAEEEGAEDKLIAKANAILANPKITCIIG